MIQLHTVQRDRIPGFPGSPRIIVKRIKPQIIIFYHTIFPVQIIIGSLSGIILKPHFRISISDIQFHFIHPVALFLRLIIEDTVRHVVVITDDRYLFCHDIFRNFLIIVIIYRCIAKQPAVPTVVCPLPNLKSVYSELSSLYRLHVRHGLKITVFIDCRIGKFFDLSQISYSLRSQILIPDNTISEICFI